MEQISFGLIGAIIGIIGVMCVLLPIMLRQEKWQRKHTYYTEEVMKNYFVKAIEEAQSKAEKGYKLTHTDKESWFKDFMVCVDDEMKNYKEK